MTSFRPARTRTLILSALLALTACGTSYQMPDVSDQHVGLARTMFAEERDPRTARSGRRLPPTQAVQQYLRVVSRIEPVAESLCRQEAAATPGIDCDIRFLVDDKMPVRNAYQTYPDGKAPVVAMTIPMIVDARNEDELAFVLGHEAGHHIGRHIRKQQQQAAAGAILMAAITAYGQASATGANPNRDTGNDSAEMQNAIELGAGLGNAAFSQTYELESDLIGTWIAAAAGYDPVRGALFFARPEPARSADGALSFWGTHPPGEARLATVLAAAKELAETGTLIRKR